MRTIRAIHLGGPHCGTEFHPPERADRAIYPDAEYRKTARKDNENRQVFHIVHSGACKSGRVIPGLRECNLD